MHSPRELYTSVITNSSTSILNAIGTGFGGAIGLNLQCHVKASLLSKDSRDENSIVVKNGSEDKHGLIPKCVSYVERFLSKKVPIENKLSIEIDSDIPLAVGLKSSSAVSTGVVKSVARLLSGSDISARRILQLSCNASKASGASKTGAFDDAICCLLGGLAITDNRNFRVLRHEVVPKELGDIAIVRIPAGPPVFTSSIEKRAYSPFKKNSLTALDLAIRNEIMGAMLMNSLVQCATLGYSSYPITSAMEEGATCAGISGKGPAVVALCSNGKIARRIERKWLIEANASGKLIKIRNAKVVVQPKELLSS